jgi:hypothetical protein
MLRRHDANDDLRAIENSSEIIACGHRVGNRAARKKSFIHMVARYGLANVQLMCPEPDAMRSLAA